MKRIFLPAFAVAVFVELMEIDFASIGRSPRNLTYMRYFYASYRRADAS